MFLIFIDFDVLSCCNIYMKQLWNCFRKEMQIFCYQRKVSRNQSISLQVNFMFLCYVIDKTLNVQQTALRRCCGVEKRKCIFSLVTNFSPPRLSQFGVKTIIWELQNKVSLSQHKYQPVAKNTQRNCNKRQTANSSRRIGDKQSAGLE